MLRAAVDYDELTNVRSTALVLASRVHDYPTTLGLPQREPVSKPLPWLTAPDVGHPGWNHYLKIRADLIKDRVRVLGTLAAAYREQYRVTDLPAGEPGTAPPEGTRQRAAYHVALQDATDPADNREQTISPASRLPRAATQSRRTREGATRGGLRQ